MRHSAGYIIRYNLRIISVSCSLFVVIVQMLRSKTPVRVRALRGYFAAPCEEEESDKRNDKSNKSHIPFMFYDFETRHNETLEGIENVRLHVPLHPANFVNRVPR